MTLDDKVHIIARELFPDRVFVQNCFDETGNKGNRCRICDADEELWSDTLKSVRDALIKAEITT